MLFIDIYAENEQTRNEILDWMIKQLFLEGDMSLMDLIRMYDNRIKIVDCDVFGYYDIGWNITDLYKFFKAKRESNNLEIPTPKCCFEEHYT